MSKEIFLVIFECCMTFNPISRSQQAPVSVFHPRDKSGKMDCDCLRPLWCNIKVDPER